MKGLIVLMAAGQSFDFLPPACLKFKFLLVLVLKNQNRFGKIGIGNVVGLGLLVWAYNGYSIGLSPKNRLTFKVRRSNKLTAVNPL